LLTNEEIVSHVLRRGSWEDTIESIAGQTVTFSEDTPFSQIWGVFQRLPIRRAIVTCGEKPIGIVNRGQLLRRLASSLELAETQSELGKAQDTSLHQIFDEIKRTADNYLDGNAAAIASDQQDVSLIVAATQLQELASQLLKLSFPSQGRNSKLATCSGAALMSL
jgi:signal-transduction protein with cAMP-binding, CBS, and nucleotidyltransferase domain